jgi:hypothetical protein
MKKRMRGKSTIKPKYVPVFTGILSRKITVSTARGTEQPSNIIKK